MGVVQIGLGHLLDIGRRHGLQRRDGRAHDVQAAGVALNAVQGREPIAIGLARAGEQLDPGLARPFQLIRRQPMQLQVRRDLGDGVIEQSFLVGRRLGEGVEIAEARKDLRGLKPRVGLITGPIGDPENGTAPGEDSVVVRSLVPGSIEIDTPPVAMVRESLEQSRNDE